MNDTANIIAMTVVLFIGLGAGYWAGLDKATAECQAQELRQ